MFFKDVFAFLFDKFRDYTNREAYLVSPVEIIVHNLVIHSEVINVCLI